MANFVFSLSSEVSENLASSKLSRLGHATLTPHFLLSTSIPVDHMPRLNKLAAGWLSKATGLSIEVRLRRLDASAAIAPRSRQGGMMRITLNIVALLFLLVGTIWFLQGIHALPGSFMTGQTRWAVYGGIAIAAGITLLLGANRPERALIRKGVKHHRPVG
jgi:hypothetical protein